MHSKVWGQDKLQGAACNSGHVDVRKLKKMPLLLLHVISIAITAPCLSQIPQSLKGCTVWMAFLPMLWSYRPHDANLSQCRGCGQTSVGVSGYPGQHHSGNKSLKLHLYKGTFEEVNVTQQRLSCHVHSPELPFTQRFHLALAHKWRRNPSIRHCSQLEME